MVKLVSYLFKLLITSSIEAKETPREKIDREKLNITYERISHHSAGLLDGTRVGLGPCGVATILREAASIMRSLRHLQDFAANLH